MEEMEKKDYWFVKREKKHGCERSVMWWREAVCSTRVPVANLELVKEKDAVVARNTLLRTEWMPDLEFCRRARCKHCKIVLNRPRIKPDDDQQNKSDNNSHDDPRWPAYIFASEDEAQDRVPHAG
ncbi:hypothetical protein GGF50DRAFT_117423 [Schizophyllum commune]